MLNRYSEGERLEAMVSACFRASRSHFTHLPIRCIIDPPQDMFDAKLARQIVIHILTRQFNVPRRRIIVLLGVQRWSVMQACRTVDYRCEEPVFARCYRAIAARAHDTFMRAMHQAAEVAA